jgi:hypothetical protein
MCFLCALGANEDEEDNEAVQSPTPFQRASSSLQVAIELAKATRTAVALAGNHSSLQVDIELATLPTAALVKRPTAATSKAAVSVPFSKAASSSLSLAITPESMVTPVMKKRKEKKTDYEVPPTTTSRQKDRVPNTKVKKGLRMKTQ